MKSKDILIHVFITGCILSSAAATVSAATITYVGSQMNIEDDADTPADGWRNTTPAKPLDIDGDNILGTDGYRLYAVNSNPS